MLLIASCDKPQSENKASPSSSVDTENTKPEPVVDGDDQQYSITACFSGAKPELIKEDDGAKPKPEHSFSFLQASSRIARTANSCKQEVTEAHKPTDDDRTIAYSSSNDDIATVDNKGVVTFKTAGTVTIKAEKQKKGDHLLRSAQYTLYITIKLENRVALSDEIKRAIAAHGGTVDLNYIDTSAITHMNAMFSFSAFNGDISKWDVSKVTNMNSMFSDATAFNQDISEWDVSEVTTMRSMFESATAFNQNISAWNVSEVTDMESMFRDATAFNQDISEWNVSEVTSMYSMFQGATAFNQDISEWNVSQVTSMYSMFQGATAFNQDISAWNVSQVTDMRGMFNSATAFNQDLESWGKKLHANIANNMRNARNMFQYSGAAASIPTWCTGDCDHRPTR